MTAIDTYLPDTVQYQRPQGGFFVWLTLPEEIDTATLLNQVVMPQANVSYVPGQVFYAHQDHHNGLRLNFSGVTPAAIETGIARLATVLTPDGLGQALVGR